MWARRAQSGCRCDRGEADPGADVGGAGRYRVRLEQSVGCSRPTTQSHAIVGPAEACLRRAKSSGPIRHATLSRGANDRDGRCTAARLSDGRASAAETILRTATGNGTQRPHRRRGLRSPLPNLPRNRAHEANHICTGTGLAPATSVTGLESTLASSVPVYAGNGLAPATSANGTGLAWRQLSMPYCAGVALAGTGV
jgi:hypothetical protein